MVSHFSSSLMTVDNFDIRYIILAFKPETDTPSVIYANAVLSFPVSAQSFQMICRRNTQVFETFGIIYKYQLPEF